MSPPSAPQDPIDPYNVLVETDGGFTESDFEALGAEQVKEYPEINMRMVVSTEGLSSEELSSELLKDPSILSAQPDVRVETPESRGMTISFSDGFTFDDYVDQQFVTRLGVDKAHLMTLGANTLVAIVDTGIDPTHPALQTAFAGGHDFLDADDTPLDETDGQDEDGDGLTDEAHGHGTHVAGLVALLAPEADIRMYRVLNSEGWGSASDVAEAVIRAVDEGADVINLSLGMYSDIRAVELALDYAHRNDVAVMSSAGNDGSNRYVQYPAYYPTGEAIVSVDHSDVISTFSSYGNHVFVAAPGEGILSTVPGGGYASWSGTSMSTPMATALYALLRSQNPELPKQILLDTIAYTTAAGTAVPGVTGYGRIDYTRAFSVMVARIDPLNGLQPNPIPR